MKIRSVLEDIILSVENCRAALVASPDGMVVDWMVVDSVVSPDEMAAEVADLLSRAARFFREATGDRLEDISLRAQQMSCVGCPVAEGYFLLILMETAKESETVLHRLHRAAGLLEEQFVVMATKDTGSASMAVVSG
ncbi:MAG: roadblock/LC7 domain-containing protein [Acidobacteriota bacterium]